MDDYGQGSLEEAAIAEHLASRMSAEACEGAIQIRRKRGGGKPLLVERHLRDAKTLVVKGVCARRAEGRKSKEGNPCCMFFPA